MAETIKCVHCGSPLRLPEQFIGQEVRCPSCQKTFTAQLPSAPPPPAQPPRAEPDDEPYKVEPTESRRPRAENDRPSKRRRPRDEDEDDDRPTTRRRPRDEDEDEDYPRDRRPRYDDDYPSRRYRYDDRGGVVLALGIVGMVLLPLGCCFWPLSLLGMGLGLTATLLGRSDLAQIKSGERNPSGESMTNGGMICGLITFVLGLILMLLGCLLFVVSIAGNN